MRIFGTVVRTLSLSRSPLLRAPSRLFSSLPAPDEVRSAPFPQQVKFGESVVAALDDPSTKPVLDAMFQSSDGIRGFFVSYLTSPEPASPSAASIPPLLSAALSSVSDPADIVELSIMNLIMPTAMAVTYANAPPPEDPDGPMEGSNESMSASSSLTAARARPVLLAVAALHPSLARSEIALLLQSVSSPSPGDRWSDFCDKWGYGSGELAAIEAALRGVLAEMPAADEPVVGFRRDVVEPGGERRPKRGETVTVQCTGYGKNGDLSVPFWSTKDPGGEPFSFVIGTGSVIKGWDLGVAEMGVGETARIFCDAEHGYGASGFPAWGIEPNSPLIFEIELLSSS